MIRGLIWLMWLELVMTSQSFACITFIMLPSEMMPHGTLLAKKHHHWGGAVWEIEPVFWLNPYHFFSCLSHTSSSWSMEHVDFVQAVGKVVLRFCPRQWSSFPRLSLCCLSWTLDQSSVTSRSVEMWYGEENCIQLLMIRRREKDDHVYRFKSNMITKWFTISVRN